MSCGIFFDVGSKSHLTPRRKRISMHYLLQQSANYFRHEKAAAPTIFIDAAAFISALRKYVLLNVFLKESLRGARTSVSN